ncbi:MAG: hypothetical protein HQ573_06920, partial [Desulfobacteraceae bacterium]|nr:hypothetical protein [Desulfobacteraceae bacterium]
LEYLNKAALLDLNADQSKLINQRIESLMAKIAGPIADRPKTPEATSPVK